MMHAIIDTDTQDIGVFVWRHENTAAVFIGRDDLEGTTGYLRSDEIRELIRALAVIYTEMSPNYRVDIRFSPRGNSPC